MSKGTLNKTILIGRLGKDPELRYTPSGAPVANFSIATDDSYKNKDGEAVDQTDWHKIVVWNKLAEICGQYLKKGSLVYIEGKQKTRSYEDKDGVSKYITEIVANQMVMLGEKSKSHEDGVSSSDSQSEPTSSGSGSTNNDDLPF